MSRQDNGGPFTCGALISPARMYVDPEPEERCDIDVENEDDHCPAHVEADDDFDYERYREDKAEREADPDYYTDHGDF